MEADETKKQGRMTCADSTLQVCTQVQGHEADIALVCNYTKQNTTKFITTNFSIILFSEMCVIHTNFYVYSKKGIKIIIKKVIFLQ